VLGAGCRVVDAGFRIYGYWDLGFGVEGSGFMILDLGFTPLPPPPGLSSPSIAITLPSMNRLRLMEPVSLTITPLGYWI